MVLLDMKTPGVNILRPLSVFGSKDSPHGHAEVEFKDVRVPASNMLLGKESFLFSTFSCRFLSSNYYFFNLNYL